MAHLAASSVGSHSWQPPDFTTEPLRSSAYNAPAMYVSVCKACPITIGADSSGWDSGQCGEVDITFYGRRVP